MMKTRRLLATFLALILTVLPMASFALTGTQQFEDNAVRNGRSVQRQFEYALNVEGEDVDLSGLEGAIAFFDAMSATTSYQWSPGLFTFMLSYALDEKPLMESYVQMLPGMMYSASQDGQTVLLCQEDVSDYFDGMAIALYATDSYSLPQSEYTAITYMLKAVYEMLFSMKFDGATYSIPYAAIGVPGQISLQEMADIAGGIQWQCESWAGDLFSKPIKTEAAQPSELHDSAEIAQTYEITAADVTRLVGGISKVLYEEKNADALLLFLNNAAQATGLQMEKSALRMSIASLPLMFSAYAPDFFTKPIIVTLAKNADGETVAIDFNWEFTVGNLYEPTTFTLTGSMGRLTDGGNRRFTAIFDLTDGTEDHMLLSLESGDFSPLIASETMLKKDLKLQLQAYDDETTYIDIIVTYDSNDTRSSATAFDTWRFAVDYIVHGENPFSVSVFSRTQSTYDLMDVTGTESMMISVSSPGSFDATLDITGTLQSGRPIVTPIDRENAIDLGKLSPAELRELLQDGIAGQADMMNLLEEYLR